MGSTFGFILGFKKAVLDDEMVKILAPIEVPKESITETLLEKVRVLVVEDVSLNQLLIKIILLDFGFDTDIAGNGKIAIECLQKNDYDIILMDLQMPVMDGFEATAYIRNNMKSQIPIIALTADITSIDVNKCKAVGMNDYISKPIDELLLYDKISKILKNPELLKSTV